MLANTELFMSVFSLGKAKYWEIYEGETIGNRINKYKIIHIIIYSSQLRFASFVSK